MEKVILFGLGGKLKSLFEIYKDSNMFKMDQWAVAITDNNSEMWGSDYEGIPVIPPEKIVDYEYDKIVVCPEGAARDEITKQLGEMGIDALSIACLKEYTSMPQDKLDDCKVVVGRENFLKYYDKNLTIAEIGVAFGAFSKQLLKEMQPEKFYAIDYFFQHNPYLEGCGGMFNNAAFRKSGLTIKEFYEKKFQSEIESGKMEVRQGFSWDVLAEFPDRTFDFIYLDAAHDFGSVQKDISVIAKKIKAGGIVQFNDYGYVHAQNKVAFGVLPAVNEYLWNHNCKVLGYCINPNGLDDLVVQFLE